MLLLSLLLLLREWGLWFSDAIVWPVLLAGGGAALIWRQSAVSAPPAEPAPAAPERTRPDRPADPLRALRLPTPTLGPAAIGATLVVAAGLVFLWLNDALAPARDVILAVLVVVVALTLILAPWWLRLVRGLTAERAERIRSQERSELAAHLHDSVLQTLALVQKRADDPRAVANLARRQERELRAWLDGGRPAPSDSLATSLEAAAAEVEETHGVPIDVVAVGDAPVDERGAALVAAAREALVNAAKFAGGAPVQLYAEVGEQRTEVFVRDRGPGFDPDAVPEDRRGLRESIVGPHGPPRRPRRRALRARRRHRGRAGDRAMTSVVIVDDHHLFRAGVRAELDGLVEVLGDAATVEEAIRCIVEKEPDVVLLDVQMPGGGGVEVIRQVAVKRPAQRFLALSVSDAAEDVIAIIRAGARGYVTKTISGAELADAVRRVAEGDAVFSPRLAGFVLDAFAGAASLPPAEVDPELDQLSPREREVLRHIARGYLYKEIALRLGISAKTVEAHVSAVLRKLQLSNRHELSRWAVERRLVE